MIALAKSAKCNMCFFKLGANVIINGGGKHTAQVAEFVDHRGTLSPTAPAFIPGAA